MNINSFDMRTEVEENSIKRDELIDVGRDIRYKADRFMLCLLWAHVPIAGFLASYSYGTWREGLIFSLIISLIGSISYVFSRGSFAHRLLNGLLLMSYSVVLITVQQGRIEMHFHVFACLPLLILYKDWRIIPPAAFLTALHHTIFNYCQQNNYDFFGLPLIVFNYGSGWDIVALHSTFVIIQSSILVYYARLLKSQQDQVEDTNLNLESLVEDRTKDLKDREVTILTQQEQIVSQAKLSSLGEMAGGIAHEINNPLAIISGTMKVLRKLIEKDKVGTNVFNKSMDDIDKTILRITKIINGLRNVSRETADDDFEECSIQDVINDVLPLCSEKFRMNEVSLEVLVSEEMLGLDVEVLRVQVSQVILNLLSNAFDEIVKANFSEKWVRIEGEFDDEFFTLKIRDSGKGLSKVVREKMFEPFFTTKETGKGTGLGLSLSHTIALKHKGDLSIDAESENTCFVFKLPRRQDDVAK